MDEVDEAMHALSHPVRRDLIGLLVGHREEAVELDELARRLAGRRRSTTVEQLCVELHHRHLPILARSGYVEFDDRSREVRCRDRPPVVDELLSVCEEHSDTR